MTNESRIAGESTESENRRPVRYARHRVAGIGIALATAATAATLSMGPAHAAGPQPDFQLPFLCGQAVRMDSWGHAPALDITREPTSATEGTQLVAPARGVVNQSYSNPSGAGNIVQIDHGGGWFTTYIHLQSRAVAAGDTLERGAPIGRVGKTGVSSRGVPHLHFEMAIDRNGDGRAEWGTPNPERVAPLFNGVTYSTQNNQTSRVSSQNCGTDSGWSSEDLGGEASRGPAVTSRGPNYLDVFVVGVNPDNSSNGALHNRRWPGTDNQFTAWRQITGPVGITSDPAAASWNPNRIDVAARGPQGEVLHAFSNNAGAPVPGYSTMTSLGANPDGLGRVIDGAPALVSWAEGRLDVFALDSGSKKLIHKWLSGGTWSAWEVVGGNRTITSAPTAASWTAGRLDVFTRGAGNQLQQLTYKAGVWGSWVDLAGGLTSDPDATSGAPGMLTVVVKGTDNHVWQRDYTESTDTWSAWVQVPGTNTNAPPAVVSWSGSRLDLFHRDPTDNSLTHRWKS